MLLDRYLPRIEFDSYDDDSYERNVFSSKPYTQGVYPVSAGKSKPKAESYKNSLQSLSKGMSKAASLDYKEGDRVSHIKYGSGTVISIEDDVKDHKITVEFDNAGRKVMYAMFAKLKKL